ncbi:hypothetical protein GPALN_002056 [Globodera pallida]|nr:hypothetical protein GPALN_002056 [Globodera pallida]
MQMFVERWKAKCRIQNQLVRMLLCEFVATAFLIFVGLAVEVQAQFNSHPANSSSIGWGLALVFAVQMAFPLSGGHLNPAVSLSAWSFGNLPFAHFLLYSIAQTAGAFIGAALTYLIYFDKIAEFDGGARAVYGPKATAAVFATYPGPHLSLLGSIIDQTSCTAVLCFIIGIITDKHNRIPTVAQPVMMGMMLTVICMAFGMNAGNAMNPARDFGPRLFTFMAGYGWEVFSYNSYKWFWVPILCPLFGAIVGSWAYQLIISAQIGPTEEEEERSLSPDQSVTKS